MRLTYILSLVGLLGAVSASASANCDHDNCLRAVIASAFPTRSGLADCESFFKVTVTPKTTTLTATVISATTTTTDVIAAMRRRGGQIEGRQTTVVPTNIPAYASACSGAVRYSSACSCVGAVPMTVTAATPVAVTTTTTTATTITTSTIPLVKPIVALTQFSVPGCPSIDADGSYTLIQDTCVPLTGSSRSANVGSFLPGNVETMASQCSVNFYSGADSCTTLLSTIPAIPGAPCQNYQMSDGFTHVKLTCP